MHAEQQEAVGSTAGDKNMARGSCYFILFAIFATITTAKYDTRGKDKD